MLSIFNRFPREVSRGSVHRKPVDSMKELVDVINKNNGKVDLYVGIYGFEPHITIEDLQNRNVYGEFDGKVFSYEDSVVIDKIYFDLDDDITHHESMQKLHYDLMKRNEAHLVYMSGFGYHVYVLAKEETLYNKKGAVFNYQNSKMIELGKYICKKCKDKSEKELFAIKDSPIVVCETCGNKMEEVFNLPLDVCEKCIGNVSKISRIPNTFNTKNAKDKERGMKRYCIPLNQDMTENWTHEEICKLASKQNFDWEYMGRRKISLMDYDSFSQINSYMLSSMDFHNIEIDVSRIDKRIKEEFKTFSRPAQALISLAGVPGRHVKGYGLGFEERFALLVYLHNEHDYILEDTIAFMKKILPKKGFIHTMRETIPQYVWRIMMSENKHYNTPKCMLD